MTSAPTTWPSPQPKSGACTIRTIRIANSLGEVTYEKEKVVRIEVTVVQRHTGNRLRGARRQASYIKLEVLVTVLAVGNGILRLMTDKGIGK